MDLYSVKIMSECTISVAQRKKLDCKNSIFRFAYFQQQNWLAKAKVFIQFETTHEPVQP